MTEKSLIGLIFVLFIELKLYMLFVRCSQVSAFMRTNGSLAGELHLELRSVARAVNHRQKPPNTRGSEI